eukprot:CAMPEP_0182449022 /NCGR_PEP_ID=MMETSP1172-20130603/31361_1 /TAXON_ID=708627 /ORGANISM="Timspurckia oligopyrenoides, Strain CCMP3278" /LENGTH=362 /DNA_ID=CAMNT_0024646109 /DNA_START=107 /DNA_END=1195 /DNA_ORIENTATION=-
MDEDADEEGIQETCVTQTKGCESSTAIAKTKVTERLRYSDCVGGSQLGHIPVDSHAFRALLADKPMNLCFTPNYSSADSVEKLVSELRQVIDYVESRPSLSDGNASFLRDRLRTLVAKSSSEARTSIRITNQRFESQSKIDANLARSGIESLPDDVIGHVFSFLDGPSLANAQGVSKRWKSVAETPSLWKKLCIDHWNALAHDEALWPIVCRPDPTILESGKDKWRLAYPYIRDHESFKVRIQKTGRFVCNAVVHRLAGPALNLSAMPDTIIVERRFNVLHLESFVVPESSILYFEPEDQVDKEALQEFIAYLSGRNRAGLALDERHRFMVLPPCEYSKDQLEYYGNAMLGVVQDVYHNFTS